MSCHWTTSPTSNGVKNTASTDMVKDSDAVDALVGKAYHPGTSTDDASGGVAVTACSSIGDVNVTLTVAGLDQHRGDTSASTTTTELLCRSIVMFVTAGASGEMTTAPKVWLTPCSYTKKYAGGDRFITTNSSTHTMVAEVTPEGGAGGVSLPAPTDQRISNPTTPGVGSGGCIASSRCSVAVKVSSPTAGKP